jgi:hypothetical protein
VSSPRVFLRPTTSPNPEDARDARARAWRFVLDCHEKKEATHPGGPEDYRRFVNKERRSP